MESVVSNLIVLCMRGVITLLVLIAISTFIPEMKSNKNITKQENGNGDSD